MSRLAAETPQSGRDEYVGVFPLKGDVSAIDVWQGIHASIGPWVASAGQEAGADNRKTIDQSDLALLKALETFPAQRWVSICNGVGWTTCGAIASSWCQSAHLGGVIVLWRKALNGQKPGELELRPARFLNPVFLPASRLGAIVEAGEDIPGTWLLLAAHKGLGNRIDINLPPEKLTRLDAALKALIE